MAQNHGGGKAAASKMAYQRIIVAKRRGASWRHRAALSTRSVAIKQRRGKPSVAKRIIAAAAKKNRRVAAWRRRHQRVIRRRNSGNGGMANSGVKQRQQAAWRAVK